jgi:replicative DNA helicase
VRTVDIHRVTHNLHTGSKVLPTDLSTTPSPAAVAIEVPGFLGCAGRAAGHRTFLASVERMFDDGWSVSAAEGGVFMAVADDLGMPPTPGFERQPPQDIQAEQSVLGGMLLSKDAIADVVEVLRSTDFYRPAHQIIYDTILDLYGRGEPADAVTVSAELTRSGQLMRVGGAPYLHTLISSVPTAANAGYYAVIVAERATLRRLVEAGTRIVQLGYGAAAGQGGEIDEIVDRAQAEIYDVTERRLSEDYVRLEQLLQGTMDEIDAISSRGGASLGVPTGFTELDQITNGLHAGQMVIVAARPAIGKALAVDTPLPTPTGWTTMGEVEVGDQLFGADGRPTTVVEATEVLIGRPCYEVEFCDGSVIVADAQHRWKTSHAGRGPAVEHRPSGHYRGGQKLARVTAAARADADAGDCVAPGPPPWPSLAHSRRRHASALHARVSAAANSWHAADATQIVTTEQMRATLRCTATDRRSNYPVAVAKPLRLPDAVLPVDPYLLGGWLGDGTCGSMHGRLQDLGVLGDRHIPAAYLRASQRQRRDLLAGLLDADGSVSERGAVQFAATTRRLAADVLELALSLGYRATMRATRVDGRTAESSTCFVVTFTPSESVFRLRRTAERCLRSTRTATVRYVVDVRPVPSVPMRCVQVDNGEHLYLAGRSMIPTHNSTLGLDLARSCSIKHGMTSVIFSLEMSRSEITMRLLSAEAKVPLHHMRSGHMSDDDWARLARRMGEVADAPLFIDDSPNLTMMEIRAKARRLRQRNDLRLVVVDYMQLMTSGKRVESRQVEVSEFSRSLKLLAKELEVPVVAISQLNRGPEQRQDKKPMLADLRESGSLEQDADMVVLLHREDAYERESPRAGEADLILAKHRNGPTGTVTVAFQGHYSRFVDMAT